MSKRTIAELSAAALVTAAGVSVTNTHVEELTTSDGVVQAAEVPAAGVATANPQQQFISQHAAIAASASATYGTYPSLMLAQAALESGWGTSNLAKAPNNNYFGMTGAYNGQSVNTGTQEYGPNGYYSAQSSFRRYPSSTASFNDNGALLRKGITGDSNLYSGAWVENAASGAAAAAGLQGKYASDPFYATKLQQIIKSQNLSQYDPKIETVNETRTVKQDTPLTNAPVDSSVVPSIGTAHAGQTVKVTRYITYATGASHALTNLGWINAAALAAPTVSQAPASAASYTVTSLATVVTIKGAPATGLAVVASPAGQPTGEKLANGTAWKVTGQTQLNGVTWDRVGTNQWINAAYGVDQSQSQSPATLPAMTEVQGVVKINYVPGYGIAVWHSPAGQVTGQYLPHESLWKVNGSVQFQGKTWYQVGTNQWIDSQYAIWVTKKFSAPVAPAKATVQAPVKTAPTTSAAASTGVVTVTYDQGGVTVWDRPGGRPTGKYLTKDTKWRYFMTQKAYGATWYNLGGNQWVPAQFVKVN